jgi:DNA-binding transcriptional MerR regulator
MNSTVRYLSPAEAASRLGVSAKALRLYEQRGLVTPSRNAAGWRSYRPADMQRAADILALRALGFSLAQVVRVIEGKAEGLEPALAAHQAVLEARARELAGTIDRIRGLRSDLERGQTPTVEELARLGESAAGLSVEFELPWPWGGELFKLRDIRPLNYIVGPLGSGKTRLAIRLAEVLPDARFVGLDRAENGSATALLQADPALQLRVDQKRTWLVEDGAMASEALTVLLANLEAEGPAVLVIDMVEQGLDAATQQAVAAYLRHRRADERTLFLMTRSSAMLDLAAVGSDESIILCPANHSPPTLVAPYPGAAGYEAVATCLAAPEVRARTEGVIAWQPKKPDGAAGPVSAAVG